MDPVGAPLSDGVSKFEIVFAEWFVKLAKQIGFGAAADCFDHSIWQKGPNDSLVLISGTPSAALDSLCSYAEKRDGQDELERAELDCVEIIEVCRWFAEREIIGEDAFNLKYGGGPFTLAAPGSTGVEGKFLGYRATNMDGSGDGDDEFNDAGGPIIGTMIFEVNGRRKGATALPGCLAKLPLGSRVMWRNFDTYVPGTDDFKNENTVKIGDNFYGAHPLGCFSIEEMGVRFAAPHFSDMWDRMDQATDALASAWARVKKLRKLLAAGQTEAMLSPDSDDEESFGNFWLDREPELSNRNVEADLEKALNRVDRCIKTLAYYQGIHTLADYIARFIRVVEFETYVNPCQ